MQDLLGGAVHPGDARGRHAVCGAAEGAAGVVGEVQNNLQHLEQHG